MPRQPPLIVRLARDAMDEQAVQRLRYQIFVTEMGGDGADVDHAAGLERDPFDALCDHLLLIDPRLAHGRHVVGTYRLLPGARLAHGQPFYCDSEFDLTPLRSSGRRLLELGRSCVAPAYRGGLGMWQIWQGIASYVQDHDIEILFGAASFPGTTLADWRPQLAWLHHHHLAPPQLRVRPHKPVPLDLPAAETLERRPVLARMPSLIQAYLRLGGVIGNGVFVDHDFGTIDVCVILDTDALHASARAMATRGNR